MGTTIGRMSASGSMSPARPFGDGYISSAFRDLFILDIREDGLCSARKKSTHGKAASGSPAVPPHRLSAGGASPPASKPGGFSLRIESRTDSRRRIVALYTRAAIAFPLIPHTARRWLPPRPIPFDGFFFPSIPHCPGGTCGAGASADDWRRRVGLTAEKRELSLMSKVASLRSAF